MFSVVAAVSVATASPARPHVLLVVADDYGWNDVGYHQNQISSANPQGLQTTNVALKTPTLDRLADEGKKLEMYYVQPLCSPTRGTILTGRYPSHTGIGPSVIRPSHPYGMPGNETLLS
jgi:arylsulfatase A-like enzyme